MINRVAKKSKGRRRRFSRKQLAFLYDTVTYAWRVVFRIKIAWGSNIPF